MDSEGSITCSVKITWENKQGTIVKTSQYKVACIQLLRNKQRDLFVELKSTKMVPFKLRLKGISVFNKFMNEGKASIKFPEDNATMFFSNAPTDQLLTFLRTIFVKMTGDKTSHSKQDTSLRTQILGSKPSQYNEISPITTVQLDKAKAKAARGSDTTPSPLAGKKRKQDRLSGDKAPAAKKLYSSSPLPDPLDLQQKEVLEACLGGLNIFFTGSAGTGKSYLLKKIIGALPPDVTTATASTGVAACHIGGITLHHFAGIGGGDASLERCLKLALKPPTVTIWRKCKHLIIDEISMVDGEYFQKIEEVARKVRNSEKPFGGIQLILCGDFFQLPPVTKISDNKSKPRFCFQTKAWENCRFATFELKRIYRQNDDKFINILNKIRIGRVDQEVTDVLAATATQKIERNGILATRLCSHSKDADLINESKLKALNTESKLYEAHDHTPGTTKQLDQQTPVPSRLELRIGAQVMLLKNINVSIGLVNGARGVVKEFREGFPLVQFRNKREYLATNDRWKVKTAGGGTLMRTQVPLKLAWAFSIHKSQGLTLDCVEMALGRVFEAGQAYVALSRAQSLDTLRVLDFRINQVWANPEVIKFYRTLDQTRIIPLTKKSSTTTKKSAPKSKLLNKPLISIS